VEKLLPAIALALATFAREPRTPGAPHTPLTPREREVLAYLCRGLTNGEIAGLCGSSRNTVRNQLVRVFAKLGATTRAEAVAIALRGIE
jgi:DNA-binding CsgD family transcriptional regulator